VIQKIRDWLNAHPKIKGALVVAEGAAVGTLINYFEAGSIHLTKESMARLAVAIGGAIYLAVKNYVTQYAKPSVDGAAKTAAQVLGMLMCAFLLLGLIACNNWERSTYQSLAASKAVIDQAQEDYESNALPHTVAAYNAINTAKAAQSAAVQAFAAYEQLKATGAEAAGLSGQQAAVEAALQRISPLIAAVKALYANVRNTRPRESAQWSPASITTEACFA
jgi:hypothetical protein